MAVMIYNPKTVGGKPSSPIEDFRWEGRKWTLGVNKIKRFPDSVAKEMLHRFGFLDKVEPEDLQNIKKLMEEKEFKCSYCPAEFSTRKALEGHNTGKHKLSKDSKELYDAVPTEEGESVGTKVELSEENKEGIPTGEAVDRDGVQWVGKGVEDDTPSMIKSRSTF